MDIGHHDSTLKLTQFCTESYHYQVNVNIFMSNIENTNIVYYAWDAVIELRRWLLTIHWFSSFPPTTRVLEPNPDNSWGKSKALKRGRNSDKACGNIRAPLQVYHRGSECLPYSCLETWKEWVIKGCKIWNSSTCGSSQAAQPFGERWSEFWCFLSHRLSSMLTAGKSPVDPFPPRLGQNISWTSQKWPAPLPSFLSPRLFFARC